MNYSEQFCTAVDTIVAERLNALQFDKTILCKIVEPPEEDGTNYLVSDDLSTFTAYSSGDNKYKKNEQVYVTIPKGDYSQQKTIIGKYNRDKKDSWLSEMQKFIPVTANLFTDTDMEFQLTANSGVKNTTAFIYESDPFTYLIPSNLTHLAIKADFFADLNTAVQGEYGLKIFLKTEKKGYVLNLSNELMLGNSYNNKSYLTQERVFDLTGIKDGINKIEVVLYQNNNFKFRPLQDNEEDPSKEIKVKNISIKAGYNQEDFNSENVIIYTANSVNYYLDENKESYQKEIKLKWNRDQDGNIVNITEKSHLGKNNIKWYVRINDAEKNIGTETSENLVPDWIELTSEKDNFIYNLDINNINYKYEIKAIITNTEDTSIELESNIISFNRIDESAGELKVSLYKIENSQMINTNNKIKVGVGQSEENYFWNISLFLNGSFKKINKDNLKVEVYGTSNLFLNNLTWNNVLYSLSNAETTEDQLTNWIESTSFSVTLDQYSYFNESYVYKFILVENDVKYETLVTLFLTVDLDYSTNLIDNNKILYNEFGLLINPSIEANLTNYNNDYYTVFYNDELDFNIFEGTRVNCPELYVWGKNPVKLIQFIQPVETEEDQKVILASYSLIMEQEKYGQNNSYNWKITASGEIETETTINLINMINNSGVQGTILLITDENELGNYVGTNANKGCAVLINSFGIVMDDPILILDNANTSNLKAPPNGQLLYESGSNLDNTWIKQNLKKNDVVRLDGKSIKKIDLSKINKLNSWLGQGKSSKNGLFSGTYLGNFNGEEGLYSFKDGFLDLSLNSNGIKFGKWNIESNFYSNETPHGWLRSSGSDAWWIYVIPEHPNFGDGVKVNPEQIQQGELYASYSAVIPGEGGASGQGYEKPTDCIDFEKNDGTYTLSKLRIPVKLRGSGTDTSSDKIQRHVDMYYYVKFPEKSTGSYFGIGGSDPSKYIGFSEQGVHAWGCGRGHQKWLVYLNSIFGIYRIQNSDNGNYRSRGSLVNTDISGCTWDGSSDINLKKNILEYTNKEDKFFDQLKPISFEWKDKINGLGTRFGFIAQDVEKALKDTQMEKYGIVKKGENLYLSYMEFIPLNTWQIQKLKTRVTNLEDQIKQLQNEVKELKNDIT